MQTVTSKDGTAIAHAAAGGGPAVVLAELLPRATYRTLPGQDHSAFWMAPDAVAASIAGFLHATAR